MSDPTVPLKCPRCGEPLSYRKTGAAWRRRLRRDALIETTAEAHLYHCSFHGFYALWPDGRLGQVWNANHWYDPDDFADSPNDGE